MKKYLVESFTVASGKILKKDGTTIPVVYIDPSKSESTFPYKDTIKNKYNGVWLQAIKSWGWFVGKNKEQTIKNNVAPCLKFLNSVVSKDKKTEGEIEKIIDTLIKALEDAPSISNTQSSTTSSANDIKKKLESFKEELVKCLSDEEFKKTLEPILRFQRAQGHRYSFANALLIYLQDPEATMVKSRTR